MGWFKDQTGNYALGLRTLALVMFLGGLVALSVRTRPALERVAEPGLETS
jgi:hypothetical protein